MNTDRRKWQKYGDDNNDQRGDRQQGMVSVFHWVVSRGALVAPGN